MIRVEITETLWRSPSGLIANFRPALPPATSEESEAQEMVQECRVVLVQEFQELDAKPIAAYLNGLQEPLTCACGHPKHKGCCPHIDEGMGYSSRQCECKDYQTPEQASVDRKLAQMECRVEKLVVAHTTLTERLASENERASDLKDQVATLTRSRDRLRSQKGR